MEKAIAIGAESVNDLAESKIIQHIRNGDLGASKYWLANNKQAYMRPRPRDFLEEITNRNSVTGIEIKIVKTPEELEKLKLEEKNKNKSSDSDLPT